MADQNQNPLVVVQGFMYTPAADMDPLDLLSKVGRDTYFKGIAGIDGFEHDFGLEDDRMDDFIDLVKIKAEVFGWTPICEIDTDDGMFNLFEEYGAVTMEQVKENASLYIGTHTRAYQNSGMMFQCLLNSLTSEARVRVNQYSDQYTVTGYFGPDETTAKDGPCLLKTIIGLSHIDNRATVTTIRSKLSRLDERLDELDSNIVEFNSYVKKLQNRLLRRREQTQDLMTHLFSAYKACRDKEFVRYIKQKEDAYHELRETYTVDELMSFAKTKYEMMLQRGEWLEVTEADRKINALTAQIEKLNKENKALKVKGTTSSTQNSSAPKPSTENRGQGTTTRRSNTSNLTQGGSGSTGKQQGQGKKIPWYFVAPKDGEPKTNWNWQQPQR